mmetsp:Transcript_17286/g.37349  ORF Transcript_17286/g.37349 Transcript_17286/m.37349 type:complete len:232 (+) Transcript_17286:1187-1882(+)
MLLLRCIRRLKPLVHVLRCLRLPDLRELGVYSTVCNPCLKLVHRGLVAHEVLELLLLQHHREGAFGTLARAAAHDLHLFLDFGREKGEEHVEAAACDHVVVINNEVDAAPEGARRQRHLPLPRRLGHKRVSLVGLLGGRLGEKARAVLYALAVVRVVEELELVEALKEDEHSPLARVRARVGLQPLLDLVCNGDEVLVGHLDVLSAATGPCPLQLAVHRWAVRHVLDLDLL